MLKAEQSINYPELPENFKLGQAIGGGDCFFDAVAQELKRLKPEMDFTVKSLREVCKKFAQGQLSIDQSWLKEALKNEPEPIDVYVPRIEFTANDIEQGSGIIDILKLTSPIWGRSEVEGRIICKEYNVKLHVIEKYNVEGTEIWANQIVDESGSKSVDEIDYNDANTIHIINEGVNHFVPIQYGRQKSSQQRPLSENNHQPKSGQKRQQDLSCQGSGLRKQPLGPLAGNDFNQSVPSNAQQGNQQPSDPSNYIQSSQQSSAEEQSVGRNQLQQKKGRGKRKIGELVDSSNKENKDPDCLQQQSSEAKISSRKRGRSIADKDDIQSKKVKEFSSRSHESSKKQKLEHPTNYDTPDEELINIIKGRNLEEEKLTKITELFEKNPKLNVNLQDKYGNTPLHIAVRNNEQKIIEFLVKNEAKIDIKNNKDNTPLDIAKSKKVKQILELHTQPSQQASAEKQSVGRGQPQQKRGRRKREIVEKDTNQKDEENIPKKLKRRDPDCLQQQSSEAKISSRKRTRSVAGKDDIPSKKEFSSRSHGSSKKQKLEHPTMKEEESTRKAASSEQQPEYSRSFHITSLCSSQELKKFLKDCNDEGKIAIHFSYENGELSLSCRKDSVSYIDQSFIEDALKVISLALPSCRMKIIVHDIKGVRKTFPEIEKLLNSVDDLKIMSYSLDTGKHDHSIPNIVAHNLSEDVESFSASTLIEIHEKLEQRLSKEERLKAIYTKFDEPLMKVIFDMEKMEYY